MAKDLNEDDVVITPHVLYGFEVSYPVGRGITKKKWFPTIEEAREHKIELVRSNG